LSKNNNPISLGTYRHYKGNEYEVIGFSKHSETLEDMVIYKPLNDESGTWVRPLSMWENAIMVDGKTVKRFEYIGTSKRRDELTGAHKALFSAMQKCEKINLDNLTKSRRTLLERRIAALKIALDLIDKELAQ
jgi:hypothetical protein